MSTAHQFDSFPRFHIDDELNDRLDSLDMTSNLTELRELGYTVIENPAPIEFTKRLRETIMRLVQETEGERRGYTAALLVGRDPIFDEILLNPKLRALTDLTLGRGARGWAGPTRRSELVPRAIPRAHADHHLLLGLR